MDAWSSVSKYWILGFQRLQIKPAKSQGFEVHGYYLSISLTIGRSFPWKLV